MAPAHHRINPTLFDKLVSDGAGPATQAVEATTSDAVTGRTALRFYTVPSIERFNERALRATVRREIGWILNTTSLESVQDLGPYPQVRTSVLNYGVRDLAGRHFTRNTLRDRGRNIRDAVRAFEPRLEPTHLEVETLSTAERDNSVTFVIRGDITSAVRAMPVEFKTDLEVDTCTITLRD